MKRKQIEIEENNFPGFVARPLVPNKRNFDEIDSAGFEGFAKRCQSSKTFGGRRNSIKH